MRRTLVLKLLLVTGLPVFSQDQRVADHNSIGWIACTGTFNLDTRFALYAEYQWRSSAAMRNRQQDLLRTGLIYSIRKDVKLVAGYAFANTYSYGDYPAARAFPEHRVFEQLFIKNPVGSIDLSHRFMLEQRFVGKVSGSGITKNTQFRFLNRMRYRVRAEIPFHKSPLPERYWSLVLQDELFIGWGKNTGANVFDQNRVGILLGYRPGRHIKLEGGYINQTLQQAALVNNRAVFQYNNGFLLSAGFNIDLFGK